MVAIDVRGEAYSLSRWSGVKAKDVRERIPDADFLPSAQEAKAHIARRMTEQLKAYIKDIDDGYKRASPAIEHKRQQMIARHGEELKTEYTRIAEREKREQLARSARLPKGFSGIWSRITGKLSKIKDRNEMEALRSWQRDRAEKDALVQRQIDAGAVTLGKSNTPEWGAGSNTFNDIFGATSNPYDLSKTCGGSSGGAGAALAARMVPIADGSDMGGSLRNPGNFNNVVGFRTSPQ